MQGTLEDDLAALRKLRDDDESGAIKESFGDGEDPRKWKLRGDASPERTSNNQDS